MLRSLTLPDSHVLGFVASYIISVTLILYLLLYVLQSLPFLKEWNLCFLSFCFCVAAPLPCPHSEYLHPLGMSLFCCTNRPRFFSGGLSVLACLPSPLRLSFCDIVSVCRCILPSRIVLSAFMHPPFESSLGGDSKICDLIWMFLRVF